MDVVFGVVEDKGEVPGALVNDSIVSIVRLDHVVKSLIKNDQSLVFEFTRVIVAERVRFTVNLSVLKRIQTPKLHLAESHIKQVVVVGLRNAHAQAAPDICTIKCGGLHVPLATKLRSIESGG